MEPHKLDYGKPDSSVPKKPKGPKETLILFRVLAGTVALLMWIGIGFVVHKIGLHGWADWGSLIFVGLFAVGMTVAAIGRG